MPAARPRFAGLRHGFFGLAHRERFAMPVQYSADRSDLFTPARNATYFQHGQPRSDEALCAELTRLAYFQVGANCAYDRRSVVFILSSVGFAECIFFERSPDTSVDPTYGGAHGFLAIDRKNRLAILCFRGASLASRSDIWLGRNSALRHWDRGLGHVHSGFARALESVWPEVEAALEPVKDYKLLFTGHGLGAAIVTLAASLWRPSALYTFGSPRIGDREFVNTLNGVANSRYVDCCDLIARVSPTGSSGYEHIPGDIHYIDRRRIVRKLDPEDSFIRFDHVMAAVGYFLRHAWIPGNVLSRGLADHAPVNYVWPVTAAAPSCKGDPASLRSTGNPALNLSTAPTEKARGLQAV